MYVSEFSISKFGLPEPSTRYRCRILSLLSAFARRYIAQHSTARLRRADSSGLLQLSAKALIVKLRKAGNEGVGVVPAETLKVRKALSFEIRRHNVPVCSSSCVSIASGVAPIPESRGCGTRETRPASVEALARFDVCIFRTYLTFSEYYPSNCACAVDRGEYPQLRRAASDRWSCTRA